MNEKQLSWNYKVSMDTIRGTDEEKARATGLFDRERSSAGKAVSRHRIPGIVAAAIAVVCIFAFGGVTVWAMTDSFAFRDFFFKNSEKEFEDVYSDVHRELVIDKHKIICEGSVYDESTGQGALNFSFWDAQGQPVEFGDNINLLAVNIEPCEYTALTAAFCFQLGADEGYLFLNGIDEVSTFPSGNSLFVTFSRLDWDKPPFDRFEYKDMQFLLLDRDAYQSLKNDIAALDEDKLFSWEQDNEKGTQENNFSIDYRLAQSELANVLSKYDPQSIESIQFPPQVIRVENFNLTVGRTNLVMEYNEKERTIDSFAMIREDGTRIGFRLDERYIDSAGNPTDTRIHWIVDGVGKNGFSAGAGNLNGDIKISLNLGFILGSNERITIEANGNTYQ